VGGGGCWGTHVLLHPPPPQITTRGPLSVADFMRMALTHPQHGYYTARPVDAPVLSDIDGVASAAASTASAATAESATAGGRRGDFITSPQISQMFGEVVGVWVVAQWQAAGFPDSVCIIECGPGLGTLAYDVLRVLRRFQPVVDALLSRSPGDRSAAEHSPGRPYRAAGLRLVEVSAPLRLVQASKLGVAMASVKGDAVIAGGAVTTAGVLPGLQVTWHERFEDAVALDVVREGSVRGADGQPAPSGAAATFAPSTGAPANGPQPASRPWTVVLAHVSQGLAAVESVCLVSAGAATPGATTWDALALASTPRARPSMLRVRVCVRARRSCLTRCRCTNSCGREAPAGGVSALWT
jgi:hypothetical protein